MLKKKLIKIYRFFTQYRKSPPCAAFFLYHTVEDKPSPWTNGHRYITTIDSFEKQLKHIAKHFRFEKTSTLIEKLMTGKLKVNSAAIHFDDGFKGYFDNALPTLKRKNIPSTLFVPYGILEGYIPLRNKITFILNSPAREQFLYRLNLSHETNAQILSFLKSNESLELSSIVNDTFEKLDYNKNKAPFINKRELKELLNDESVEIGSHTISHPMLPMLDENEQKKEIIDGHKKLEAFCGRKIDFFAYPHGGKTHFTETTEKIVSELKPTAAFSAYGGVNYALSFTGTDVKRVTISDQSGIKLKLHISSSF